MSNIQFDADFDFNLNKLSSYFAGYQVVFYPEDDPPRVAIEPYRQGGNFYQGLALQGFRALEWSERARAGGLHPGAPSG